MCIRTSQFIINTNEIRHWITLVNMNRIHCIQVTEVKFKHCIKNVLALTYSETLIQFMPAGTLVALNKLHLQFRIVKKNPYFIITFF